ncbi:hypothetical protein [Mesorhizobium sp. 10J20-29]
MRSAGTANPVELAMLRRVLDDYCLEYRIEGDDDAKATLSARIFILFSSGVTGFDELRQALRDEQSRDRQSSGSRV